MPLIGTKMPNYTFLARFEPPKPKINIHLTKSPKREHINKLYLYTLEEHNCLLNFNFLA